MAVFAATAAIMVHFGLRLSWADLVFPVGCFMALQIALFACIVGLRKYRNSRLGMVTAVVYGWIELALAGYYGSRWDLIKGLGKSDLWLFTGFMGAITLAVALMPSRWMEAWMSGAIKCGRCGHYHEGHDCTCRCRADQFKYPVFQPPA
jgi:hypothetical protein